MSNILIKDGNNTTIEIFTFEDSVSVHHNASVPILQDGTPVFTTATPGVVQVQGGGASGSSITVSVGGNVSNQGVPIVGSDGTDVRRILTDTGGRLIVNASLGGSTAHIGRVSVVPDGTGSNFPVSIAPLAFNVPVSIVNPTFNLPVSVHPVTQSGTWTVGVNAGTALIGAVSIRQIVSVVPDGTGANFPVSIAGTVNVSIGALANNLPVSVANTVNVSANGGRFDVSVSPTQGNIPVSIGGIGLINALADAKSNTVNRVVVENYNMIYNTSGANWDRDTGAIRSSGTGTEAVVGTNIDGQATINSLFVNSQNKVRNRASGTWDMMTGTSLGLLISPVSLQPQTLNVHVCNSLPAAGATPTVSIGGAVSLQAVQIAGRDTAGNARSPAMFTDGSLLVHVCNSLPAATANTQLVSIGGAVSTQAYPVAGTDGTNARLIRMHTDGTILVHVCNSTPAPSADVSISPTQGNIPVSIGGTNVINVSANGGRFDVSVSPSQANIPVSINNSNNIPVSVAAGRVSVQGVVTVAPFTNTGAAIPTAAHFVGGTDGTNLRGFLTDSTGAIAITSIKDDVSIAPQTLFVHVCNSLPAAGATPMVSIGGAVSTQAVQVAYRDINGDARTPRTHTDGSLLVHVCNAAPGGAGGGGPTVSVNGVTSTQAVPIAGGDVGGIVRLIQTAIDGTLKTSGYMVIPSYTFTRPTDTVTYAIGDILANSTVAGTVIPLSWPVGRMTGTTNTLSIRRARVRKSGQGTTNCAVRIHIFTTATGVSVSTGDNRVFTSVWSPSSKYAGAIDVLIDRGGADGAFGDGVPTTGNEINMRLISGAASISGLMEMRGAYIPLNAETFKVDLEIFQD